ncbi:MAG: hypothetical protein HKP61_11240 [Dactylosporangium sp.]|nr:hypothetical protein [Dactylosporangium sp.]NNJ61500.1 hypothetical protein [Dactylosporangium sp.]
MATAFGVMLVWQPWAGLHDPEESRGLGACPAVTDLAGTPRNDPPSTTIAEADYTAVQLCPADADGLRTTIHPLARADARGLVARLNGLPDRRPATGCGPNSRILLNLVLSRGEAEPVVIHMYPVPCGEVWGPGGIHYGGDEIHTYLKTLVS